MKKIYLLAGIAFFYLTTYSQIVVVAGADVGSNGTYTTLGAAFASINASTQSGNAIVISITGTTTEGTSAVLNQSSGPWISLTILPVGTSSVTGNINGPLVDLSGADNVTINGLNIAGNALAMDNSNTSSNACTIRFVNDASANTIINCSLLGASGSAVSSGLGTIYFSSGLAVGNDDNTITQCNISSSASGNPVNAIFSIGSSGLVDNSSNTISINNISDYFNATTTSCGLYLSQFNLGWIITNNTFYQTATRIATAGNTYYGIYITTGIGYTISNNVIGFAAPNATGTTNLIGVSSGSLSGTFPGSFTSGSAVASNINFVGISCAFTPGNIYSSIQNNSIGGITIYTGSGASTNAGVICGIAVTSGSANIGNVTGNTIGSITGSGSIYAASTTAGAVVSGIYCTTTNTIFVQNNIIGGIDVSGTTGSTATGFKGIDISGSGIYTVSNNTIGNSSPYNIRTGYLVTGPNLSNAATTPTAASGASTIAGIISTSSGNTVNINSNAIKGIQISGTASIFTGIQNSGAVVNTINMNNNTFGSATEDAVTFTNATTGTFRTIVNSGGTATVRLNMNSNAFNRIVAVSTGQFSALTNTFQIDVAVNISNNHLGTASGTFVYFSGAQNNNFYVIYNNNLTPSTTCALIIQGNNIQGIVQAVAGTANHKYISSNGTLPFVNILNNTFTNLNVNTTGTIFFMEKGGALIATGVSQVNNNSIAGTFNNSGTSGIVTFFAAGSPSSVNGATMTETGNNFSNATVAGTTTLIGWQNVDGTSAASAPTKTITGNTFNNLTGGSGAITVMSVNVSGPGTSCSSNTISNISGTGSITGISIGLVNGQGTHNYSSNIISSLTSIGTGGNVTGISGGASTIPVLNVNNNSITVLSSAGASSFIDGIRIIIGTTVNVNANSINNLSGSGTTAPFAQGITVAASATVNVGYNKIHTITETGLNSSPTPTVYGISLLAGTTVTAHNNFIANLSAANTASTDAIRGISVNSTTALSTYNLYYNSIHVNTASNLATSGTSAVYHTTSATATTASLNMINNIIVNSSASAGAGFTAAYRRSSATLTNFAVTSNYNLLYASAPSASNVIFYDGTSTDVTLAAYQVRVAARDANSISSFPNFTSSTDLHLTPNNCSIDNKGTPVGGFTNDIDIDTRSSTIPDVGADEFDAYNPGMLAGVVGTAVCSNKAVVNTGTLYTDASCNQIARVLPSGGSAVNGVINTCVTLDAAPLTFNGEPYVQRHHDIEPATTPATVTATITLYFTDAEFDAYNTLNPVYPPLPTSGAGNTPANRANVRITQFHGMPTGGLPTTTPGNYTGTRELITPTSVTESAGTWTVTFPVTGFSGFYAHTTLTNAPLPIIVNYLTGRKQGSNHLLNWKVTCTSSPSATMTLERSSDSRNFTGINTIIADAAHCNQPFDYTDVNPLKGMNYYRLKIADADGKITYSTTVALLNAVKGFDIISIAPNPVVGDNFKFNVASAQSGKMEIVIFDMQGRLVNRQSIVLTAGYNSLPVSVATLSAGTYTIKSSLADEPPQIMRFIKQ